MVAGSYTSPKDPVFKKSEKKFKERALLKDLRDWPKNKKKKVSLKEFLEKCQY